jgi:dUTP pyrophosphatase
MSNDFFNNFLCIMFNQTHHDKVMALSIYVDGDNQLKQKYMDAANAHNNKLLADPHFYDAGFDLFLPNSQKFYSAQLSKTETFINKVDFKVKCCATQYNRNHDSFFSPFYTYVRSSVSKTPLRLANNQGIIDAGYRGSLIGMFDCIYNDSKSDFTSDYHLDAHSRILQVCAPGLVPIYVRIVDTLEELGPSTSRGEGGFGSTGK